MASPSAAAPAGRRGARRPAPARPGALLTAAAAVPLGVAALYASGLLGGLPRLLLGVALIVLGAATWRLRETLTGARIGPSGVRAIGLATVVGGAAVAGGALTGALDGRSADTPWAPLALCAVVAFAGVWIARLRPSVGGVVLAVGVAYGWMALIVALDVGPVGMTLLRAVPALGLAVAATLRVGPPAVRAATGVAAVLLATGWGGTAFGLTTVADGLVLPSFSGDEAAIGWRVAGTVVADLAIALVLVTAFVRRDPVGGALAVAAALVTPHETEAARIVAIELVPTLAVTTTSLLAVSSTARRRLRTSVGCLSADGPTADTARAAWVVALVIALDRMPIGDPRGIAAWLLIALLVLAAVTWTLRGAAATVAGAATLLGWAALQPVTWLLATQPTPEGDDLLPAASSGVLGPWELGPAGGLAAFAITVAFAAVVLRRVRTPAVVAAAGYAVASTASWAVAAGLLSDDPGVLELLALVYGPAIVVLVPAATLAVAGPPRGIAAAQAMTGAMLVLVLMACGSNLSSVLQLAADSGQSAHDAATAGLLVVMTATVACGAMLAASTARRRSTVAAIGSLAALLAGAVLLVAVGVASGARDAADPVEDAFVATNPPFGFVWSDGTLPHGDAAWVVLLVVLGTVLLVTAAWLESRRPLPVGAPVAGRHGD